MLIKSLTIYCSSSNNLKKEYYELAEEIGLFLAKKGVKLVYGGGKNGLMGTISSSVYKSGGKVIGVIPKFLTTKESINKNTTKTFIVKTMAERKKKLFDLGDSFLILPGGSGTIEEAAEIISWKYLGLHKKKIIIFNYKGYWNNFIKTYDLACDKNFAKKNLQSVCINVRNIKQFIKIFS